MLSRTLSRPLTSLLSISSRSLSNVPFKYEPPFPLPNKPVTEYRKLPGSEEWVTSVDVDGETFLKIKPEAITALTIEGMTDIAHLLRTDHLKQLSKILDDDEASKNDKFVALELLKNAGIAAGKVLPGCQDTGTGIVMGKRGGRVLTDGNDEEAISRGVYDVYTKRNLRYSQVAPQDMFTEKNTGSNLPAQIDLYATAGDEYHFMFMAKGGGSANKVSAE